MNDREQEGGPPGWKRTTLGEALPIRYGKARSEKHGTVRENTPVYGSSGRIDTFKRALTGGPSLIIGRKGTVGATYYCPEPCWPIDTVYFAEADADEVLRFFKYLLDHLQLVRLDRSTAVPGLSRDDYNSTEVFIPELDQQRLIVAEIEKQFSRLDEAVTSLKRVKANLKRYRAAVLKAAVEGELTEDWRKAHPDIEPARKLLERILAERRAKWKGKGKYKEPATPDTSDRPPLPNSWTWARWEQIGFSQNGRAFPSAQYQPSGFKLLRPGNLHVSGRIVWTEENTRCMPHKWADEFPEFIVGPRELIINLTAQSLKDEFLGRICLTGSGEACLLNQRQARLTPVLVLPEFLLWLFKSQVFRRFVDELNTGSLIQHMFTSQLADFLLPVPSLDEQQQIVAEVERRLSVIEELEATVEANLTRAERLRHGVLKSAFAGKMLSSEPVRCTRPSEENIDVSA